MNKEFFLNSEGKFIIKNYNCKTPFSNFLPGIAGVWGVPLWVFYVNRGQGVISFGIQDKNHAFLEFYPADRAYQLTPLLGFRTFIKINNRSYYEPFRLSYGTRKDEEMVISSYDLVFRETNIWAKLTIEVEYFTIPNYSIGGLVRALKIRNDSHQRLQLCIADGIPRVVPYGCKEVFIKYLSRTVEAWMTAAVKNNIGMFKLLVDPRDVSSTQYIKGLNYCYSFYENERNKVYPNMIIDPGWIFGNDTSYQIPIGFLEGELTKKVPKFYGGRTPCIFNVWTWELKKGEEKVLYSVYGATFNETDLKYVSSINEDFIKKKRDENKSIIEKIKNNALCVSGLFSFNEYIKNTYLDNILRGGLPYKFNSSIYYLFSRKHGDLERDYNRFKLLPSYFSEGESNYRDVNQNRRMDIFFNPFVEAKNIVYFLSLLRIDGYNPLVVRGEKMYFDNKEIETVLLHCEIKDKNIKERLITFLKKGFHLGEFFNFLRDNNILLKDKNKVSSLLVEKSKGIPDATLGEGFWIDHWRYNLDLIENYLYFYPDKEEELFFYHYVMCWDDAYRVPTRQERYTLLDNGRVYQFSELLFDKEKEKVIEQRAIPKYYLRFKNQHIYRDTVFAKLLIIFLNKLATLDPYGIGIEMEAGKPGWCDSLNGLPALFGSSLCETLELKRTITILRKALDSRSDTIDGIDLPIEVIEFFYGLKKLLRKYRVDKNDYEWWDKSNFLKEEFRRKTFFCLNGTKENVRLVDIREFLDLAEEKLRRSISLGKRYGRGGLAPTYFIYEVEEYIEKDKCVLPTRFKLKSLPIFLESAVHMLRVEKDRRIYQRVKEGPLYDKKLKMYRLNDSLSEESLEIGRSRVFPPGWLENESVWVHMEYKYLLEVLKSGLYNEFFEDIYNCFICFQSPQRYGRSILENSSFIVSSAYYDKNLWGKGFVARLSGATVEMLNMWIVMCLGRRPFFVDNKNNLKIRFAPILKREFFTKRKTKLNLFGEEIMLPKNSLAFKLFSRSLVVYHNPLQKDTFSQTTKIKKILLHWDNGMLSEIKKATIEPPFSYMVREGKAKRIDVYLE